MYLETTSTSLLSRLVFATSASENNVALCFSVEFFLIKKKKVHVWCLLATAVEVIVAVVLVTKSHPTFCDPICGSKIILSLL